MAVSRTVLIIFLSFFIGMYIFCGSASAAGIRVVPSTQRVLPGEDFFFDVVAEGVPAEGLGGVQFRLNVAVPGGTATGVSDLGQAGAGEVAIATPLLLSPATPTRSGIGDFFWNSRGSNGILILDNEQLTGGSALFTFAHTNGAIPPAGNGSVARFMVRVGSSINAKQINVALSDVMLLDGGPAYPLDYNNGATVQIGCFTRMPDLAGLSLAEATARLAQYQLVLGSIYEIDNFSGSHSLDVVLEQSALVGSELLCENPVNVAINTPPSEVTGGNATDKAADDTGKVVLSWTPSPSSDTAGYRVYQGATLLREVQDPAAHSVEIGGLVTGVASQLKVTAYDTHGNESRGAIVVAMPIDDVAPAVAIAGVSEGAFYRSDVTPQVTASDTNLATQVVTLNGAPYAMSPIISDGAYTLTVSATDRFANQTTQSVHFTIDKTPPAIAVTGAANGGFYNHDVAPSITVTDGNLKESRLTLNGQSFIAGTVITAEGLYTLVVFAEDLAGNTAADTISFVIDKTPPTSTGDLSVPRYTAGGVVYISGQTLLTISAMDPGVAPSGVAGIEYQLDGSPTLHPYSAPVTLAGSADGSHTVAYSARDRATNHENSQTLALIVDNTPPITSLSTSGPSHLLAGGAYAATSATTFNLQATDLLAGVARVEYRLDGGQWLAYAPFAFIGEGSHTIEYRSADNLDNLEAVKSQAVLIDNTPPITAIITGTPKHTAADGAQYVTAATQFTLVATDNLAGVAGTEYQIDGGAWLSYAPFTIPTEGSHVIAYRSTDNVGNREAEKSVTVIVDNTPPVTVITPSTPKYTAADDILFGTSATTFTLAATDNLSGVAGIQYRIDGGEWTAYTPFTIVLEGKHIIGFRSTDHVGNIETEKSLAVTIDNTPPATVITTGRPQYVAADGTLYGTSATRFTLTATDNLSGVARIEYSIDGGQWAAYSPFALPAAGSHTIGYRSTDNVGNRETEKVLKIFIDDTPPVVVATVGNPQYTTSGNLNVSGRTSITLAATDNASGVKTIEYSIDGAPFVVYGEPFTLAAYADGSHTIAYRSSDNLGNMEAAKELALILDKTTPTTAIESSDPLIHGAINTISPVTSFTLTATDNLSGVRDIWYRIDGDQWQRYGGAFALAGLKAGSHTIAYGAVDNVENEEPQQTITVRLISFAIKKSVSTDPVVLLFSGKNEDKDKEGAQRIKKESDTIATLLESIGVSYHRAMDGEGFELARRSGRYNIYLLTDDGKQDAGAEIRESVFSGDGVLFIKTRPDDDDHINAVFGVKFSGKSTSGELVVTIPEGPLGVAGSLQTTGKTTRTSITSTTAKVLGTVTDENQQLPALIYNEYGRGKALLMTFGLADSPDGPQAADLLAKSLNLLKPREHYLRPLGSIPVSIEIGNSTDAFGLEVEETIPPTATADTITPPGTLVDSIITWRRYLGSSERLTLDYYLNLPDAKGEYLTRTSFRYANYGTYRLYAGSELTFTLEKDSTELLQGAINDLQTISVADQKDRKLVDEALSNLYDIRQSVTDRDAAEDNLERFIEAVEGVAELSVEATQIRVKLDELMKIWQRKWYLLPDEHK